MHEKVSPRDVCYPRRAGSREQACGEEGHECICCESPGDILGYSHREKSRDGCHRHRSYGLCHHVHARKSENFSGPQDIHAYARFLRKVGHLGVGYGQLLCKARHNILGHLLYAGGELRRLSCTHPQAVACDGPCGRNSRRIRPGLGCDAAKFPYQSPQQNIQSTSRAGLLRGLYGNIFIYSIVRATTYHIWRTPYGRHS
jgi:hypothetical protein